LADYTDIGQAVQSTCGQGITTQKQKALIHSDELFCFVGGAGKLASSANAPACALAFAGSQQCCSNSLLTSPVRAGRRLNSRAISMQQMKMATHTGQPFSFVGGAGATE